MEKRIRNKCPTWSKRMNWGNLWTGLTMRPKNDNRSWEDICLTYEKSLDHFNSVCCNKKKIQEQKKAPWENQLGRICVLTLVWPPPATVRNYWWNRCKCPKPQLWRSWPQRHRQSFLLCPTFERTRTGPAEITYGSARSPVSGGTASISCSNQE